MTNEKIRELIERIAMANYLTASQFAKPSWQHCAGKLLWREDAKRALQIALPEIIEWCAEIAESDPNDGQTNAQFLKGKKHAAASIRKLKGAK